MARSLRRKWSVQSLSAEEPLVAREYTEAGDAGNCRDAFNLSVWRSGGGRQDLL